MLHTTQQMMTLLKGLADQNRVSCCSMCLEPLTTLNGANRICRDTHRVGPAGVTYEPSCGAFACNECHARAFETGAAADALRGGSSVRPLLTQGGHAYNCPGCQKEIDITFCATRSVIPFAIDVQGLIGAAVTDPDDAAAKPALHVDNAIAELNTVLHNTALDKSLIAALQAKLGERDNEIKKLADQRDRLIGALGPGNGVAPAPAAPAAPAAAPAAVPAAASKGKRKFKEPISDESAQMTVDSDDEDAPVVKLPKWLADKDLADLTFDHLRKLSPTFVDSPVSAHPKGALIQLLHELGGKDYSDGDAPKKHAIAREIALLEAQQSVNALYQAGAAESAKEKKGKKRARQAAAADAAGMSLEKRRQLDHNNALAKKRRESKKAARAAAAALAAAGAAGPSGAVADAAAEDSDDEEEEDVEEGAGGEEDASEPGDDAAHPMVIDAADN